MRHSSIMCIQSVFWSFESFWFCFGLQSNYSVISFQSIQILILVQIFEFLEFSPIGNLISFFMWLGFDLLLFFGVVYMIKNKLLRLWQNKWQIAIKILEF